MERAPGAEDAPIADLARAPCVVSRLRAFLHGCIEAVEGDYGLDRLFLPRPDGEPLRWNGWAWHAIAVPFERARRPYRIGIFLYAEAPAGEEAATTLPWLEVFPEEANDPVLSLPFLASALTAEALAAERQRFVSAWHARGED